MSSVFKTKAKKVFSPFLLALSILTSFYENGGRFVTLFYGRRDGDRMDVIMKCLCFSDSHGLSLYIEKALSLHRDSEVVFFLGDGLSDIERYAEKYKNIAFLAVRGNCDSSSVFCGGLVKKTEAITIGNKKIVYTHGDLYGVKYGEDGLIRLADEYSADIVLYGHTHIMKEKYIPNEKDGLYLFNPGSIGYSFGASPTYGIIDITEGGVMLSHGSFA